MTTFQLRDYQHESVNKCWEFISNTDTGRNPCIVLPTGAGKSLVLAQLAHDAAVKWDGRVIILAHVKELLEQNADKLRKLSPDLDVGIYSAGLRRRDKRAQVLVAGIQSVYNKACDFDPFDIIIVDECHLIPPDGEGRYRTFLSDCQVIAPHVRLIGLTATPYRMQTGWLCGPDNLLTDVCHDVGVKELIAKGYLSKLVSKEAMACNTSALHIRGGEFVADEAEKLMLDNVGPACEQILARTAERQSVLVFCQSIEHAVQVQGRLPGAELITGDTPSHKRADYLTRFKTGVIKYLVNVNVLTTGFDAPNVDCVCLLRPTLSPGLYYQMVGRGFRLADGKENCLVLDFAGNVRRHGPVDQIQPKPKAVDGNGGEAPTKTCPDCQSVVHAAYSVCPDCGHQFPDKMAKHDRTPDAVPVLSTEIIRETYKVLDVKYAKHVKYKAEPGTPSTLRVDYKINPIRWVSEWVCIEHEGWAKRKARQWWVKRSGDPFPDDAEQAATLANAGALAIPLEVTIQEKHGEKWPSIVNVVLDEKPEPIGELSGDGWDFPTPEQDEEVERRLQEAADMEVPF